ncbi:YfhO family protein [Candidatus Gottesmanbacteria bacterium]|nr:YfhO family protein [Candidatus Gottesmanbacteria bacterium]
MILKKFLPLFIFILLGVIFFGKTLFPPSNYLIFGGDIQDQFYFWKSYFVENVKQGIIPFWNPYSFSGTPFLAHPSTAPFYPFTVIFLLFPLPLAFSMYLYIHIVLAGFFAFWSMRKFTDIYSAYLSGIIFAFSGFMAARIYAGHIDIISTVIWMPLVFGAAVEAIRTKQSKYWVLAVFALTFQILAGYQFVVLTTVCLLLFYFFVRILSYSIQKKKLQLFHSELLILATLILFSFGISAIQYVPTLEFIGSSIRAEGLAYELATWGSYTLPMLRLFLEPFWYGNPFPEQYSYVGPGPNFFELSFYVGIVPIILFLTLILKTLQDVFRRKRVDEWFFFILGAIILFLLLSLGKNFFLHPFFFSTFPPFRLFRFPSQYLIPVVLLLSLLSGISLFAIKKKILKIIIIFVATVELFHYGNQFLRLEEVPDTRFDQHLLQAIRDDRSLYRVLPDYPVTSHVRQDWDFEAAQFLKIHSTSGYNPILLDSYYQFIDLVNKSPSSSLPNFNVEIPPMNPYSAYIPFLNIRYILADKMNDQIKSSENFIKRLEGDRFRLYEAKKFLPRYFFVDKIQFFGNSEPLKTALRLGIVDLEKEVLLLRTDNTSAYESLPNCNASQKNSLEIKSYGINRIYLAVDAICDSFVSSSEPFYPGWNVQIDGKKGKLYQGNVAFRSFFVEKGKHTVEIYYEPTIYYVGGVISVVSIGITYIFYRRYKRYVY